MNEGDRIDSLEKEISFLKSLERLIERATEMREAKVPMNMFVSSLGIYICNPVAVNKRSQESTQLKDAICTKCNGVGWYAVQVGADTQEQCQCEDCGGTGKLQLKDLLNEGLVILGKLDGFKGRNRLVEIFDKVIAKLESLK